MFKKVFVAVVAALFMANVQADTLGLYLGGQIWQSEFSGGFGKESALIDFNYKKEQQTSFFVAFEHPFPLLPNLRLSHTNFDTSSQTNSTQEFSFPEGNTVHETFIDTDVEARFNVSYVDYTLYYQLLDSRSFSLDLGLTARNFSGAITVTEDITTVNNWSDIFGNPYTATSNDTFTNKIKTNDIEPMLYIASNIGLPLKGLSVFAQGDFLLKGDRTISDYQVGLMYDLIDNRMVDFNVILGYRTVRMEFKSSDDLFSDPEIKGGFISVIAHF
jgi:outer membrane protein